MKDFVEQLRRIEKAVSAEKGDFTLFALFLREDAADKWDLVVASPWIARDKQAELKYLAGKVQSELKPDDRIRLSRIVIVGGPGPLARAFNVQHGLFDTKDNVIFGLKIQHAFIITCQKSRKRDRVPAA